MMDQDEVEALRRIIAEKQALIDRLMVYNPPEPTPLVVNTAGPMLACCGFVTEPLKGNPKIFKCRGTCAGQWMLLPT